MAHCMAHLKWEPLIYASMWWRDKGARERENYLSIMKTGGTGDVRVERNNLM